VSAGHASVNGLPAAARARFPAPSPDLPWSRNGRHWRAGAASRSFQRHARL